MGMTFYNGRNYRGAVKRGDQAWYSYDGLWERNGPGTGLQKEPLTTPAGSIPSSCFYVHSKFVLRWLKTVSSTFQAVDFDGL